MRRFTCWHAPVVPVHVRTICKERVAQETVGQEKLGIGWLFGLWFFWDYLRYGDSQVEKLTANEGAEVSVVFVVQVLVERHHQLVPFLLSVLDHFAGGVLGKMFHQAALKGEPESAGQEEEDGLPHQAERDPLVERVEHLVAVLVQVALPGAAALEVVGNVEGAVHPAVVLQRLPAHSPSRQVALDWVSEELVESRRHREDQEQRACILQ